MRVDFLQQLRERGQMTERVFFNNKLHNTLEVLTGLEGELNSSDLSEDARQDYFRQKRNRLEMSLEHFSDPERYLFHRLFDLFELKHGLGEANRILLDQLSESHQGKCIGFIAPLGAGKTTIAQATTKDLNATETVQEPYDKNPFWKESQQHPEYMLRSQMYFFLSNIFSDIKTRLHKGISISDTSTLNDILLWADWYHKTGHLTNEEYQTYQTMVGFFKDIIPKPDLLVAIVPDDIDKLKEGIRRRAEAEPSRAGELIFADPQNNDLAIQVQRLKELVPMIQKDWTVPILEIVVPPLQIFHDPSLPYKYIYEIRERLGLLGKLLDPQPEEVADEIMRILADSQERQVIIAHSKGMFSGKTTVICNVAEKIWKKRVFGFQPRAAIRDTEAAFIYQSGAILSRDGMQIPATIIEDNSLWSIVNYVTEKGVDSRDNPYIFIDEIMLFVTEADKPDEAIKALEKLRKMGFHVIVDGIDYTFQEEPFTFMHKLLAEIANNSNWHQIEMRTRCRYCEKRARGTRRWVISPEGIKRIADYSDPFDLAGSNMYEPVCCEEHNSCANQPEDFKRQELPI